ncbi:hypothetical protein LAZ67_9003283 [Cordylochernes scorpioides]|uniref:Endonuclease n=1 Tax=Cordylochernes scorpioides TaxID=51811 RepID=A0ABY6KW17_9ARAC|nr:hypothetical protein LAZ67_9003283 [Cordylochernes scorpioides]
MEREEALERLKKKRTILRTSLSKYGKRIEEYDVHKECDHEELLGQLSDVYEELRRVDEEIGKLIDIKDLEKDLKMVEEYREKAVAWTYLLKKRSLVVAEGMQRETATATKKEYPGEIGRPTLTGMWLNFWNAFDSSINRNEHLTTIDKFNYLKAYLGGTAAQTVEGFCLSEENYDKAVELLKKRFGKGERLIDVHMNNLLALKPLRVTKDVRAFRELYGRILVQIRSLESLGVVVESYGNLLCPLLLKLLPSDLKLELHREFTGAFSLGDLIEFLERQLIALESTFAVNKRKNCAFCERDHESTKCEFAENLTLEDKLGKLKKKGACFRCLKYGNLSKFCKVKTSCTSCGELRHSRIMCPRKNQNATPARGMMRDETLTNLTTPVVLLLTLRVTIRGKCKERMGRILIDTGSQRSYVLQDTAEEMGYECSKKESLRHSLFGGSNTELYEHGVYDIRLSNLDGSYGCNFEALSQDVICDSVPRVHQGKWMQDLSAHDIELTDLHRGPLEILIGADIAGKLLTGEHRRLPSGLVAVQTRLGWTLMGKIPATEEETSVSGLCTTSLLTSDLENLWRLEAIGISDARRDDSIQKETEEYFARTISQDCEGRYQVALPWIGERKLLTDNRDVAEKRLANVRKHLVNTGNLAEYEDILENPTTKVRPVFDASAKKKGKLSLNDCLERGPNMIETIPRILNKFRKSEIGVSSDIEKAFLQIGIREEDRDYLRFLWYDKEGNVMVLRHARVVFGITTSPYILLATLFHHLNKAPEHWQETAELLRESLYIDNCVASFSKVTDMEKFVDEAQRLLASAHFNLRDWTSNVTSIMCDGPRSDRGRLLGMTWNQEKDTLACSLENLEIQGPINKRKVLSLASRIFDPVGFTCPVTLVPRLILQETWLLKLSWDEPLPENLSCEFLRWLAKLESLKSIAIPRWLCYREEHRIGTTLHVFCDASKASYATCIFLRIESEQEVTCQLVQARSRVAPLKGTTIPRLELLTCLVGGPLDSMNALHWIKGKDNWATFVMNRVMEIRSLSETEDCRFSGEIEVVGEPELVEKTKKRLAHREIYPDPDIVNSEKRKIVLTSTCIEREKDQYYYRFSNYYKILRVTAWMNRFLTNARGTTGQRVKGDLTVNEIKRAELMLVRVIQRESFTGPEDKRLKVFKLCCDSLGLLRVKTKISRRQDLESFRMPLLLPSDHDLVYLLIRWKHETWGHVGLQTLMNLLREDYWILKFRRTVRRVIHQCVKCRRFTAKSGSVESVELPENRVRDASIFEVVGIDLTGPLVLRNRRKVWIVIFTCAVYRAVHLELVTSLSTENFLQAFRRFVARRGRPYVVYSDNGTNFRGASRALGNLDNAVVQSESTKQNINWKFIPPSAPWWGGWWERLIGLLKKLLRKILGQARLEFEELYTIIYVEDLSPLTPALFLHDLKEIGVPDLDSIERASLQKRYRFRQRLREDLRKRFRTEYFGFLRQETRRRSKTRPIKVGDLVLIGQDNAKRVNWPLARVVEVYPGRDGPVRVAKLRTSKGVQIRPVQRLYNLEIPADLGSTLRSIQSEPRRGGSRGEASSPEDWGRIGGSGENRIISGIEASVKNHNHQDRCAIRNHVSRVLQRPLPPPPNSQTESKALRRLMKQRSIVISRSDKGTDTVILDRSSYHAKILEILQDTATFSQISAQDSTIALKTFKSSLNRMKRSRLISTEENKSFTTNLPNGTYIYGLPKVHKPSVPLRPIIAYHLSPAYPLAKYLSNYLSPLLNNNRNPVKTNSITSLSQICLNMSTFTFDHIHFKQIRGSPMGSPLSSIAAELVMTRIDKWVCNLHCDDILFWRRYVDDILCICKTDHEETILSTLNSYNPNLSFTMEKEQGHIIPFLDILIIRTPASFHTTVYYKNSSTPSYTHFNSFCPIVHKINIVKTLTRRLHTHCSLPIFKTTEKARIISHLTAASYPLTFINKHTYSPAPSNPPPVFRTTCMLPYSPLTVSISRLIRPFGIRTFFINTPSIHSLLRHPITKTSTQLSPLDSSGAVYSVSCEHCSATYVGETGRTVTIRMSEHTRNINNNDPRSLIYQHVASTGHSFNNNHPTIHYRNIPNLHQRLMQIIQENIVNIDESIELHNDPEEISKPSQPFVPEPSPDSKAVDHGTSSSNAMEHGKIIQEPIVNIDKSMELKNVPEKLSKPYGAETRPVIKTVDHGTTSSKPKKIQCDECKRTFTHKNSLRAHIQIHGEKRQRFHCEHCPASCGRSRDLKRHMKNYHPGLEFQQYLNQMRSFSMSSSTRTTVQVEYKSAEELQIDSGMECPIVQITQILLQRSFRSHKIASNIVQITQDLLQRSFRSNKIASKIVQITQDLFQRWLRSRKISFKDRSDHKNLLQRSLRSHRISFKDGSDHTRSPSKMGQITQALLQRWVRSHNISFNDESDHTRSPSKIAQITKISFKDRSDHTGSPSKMGQITPDLLQRWFRSHKLSFKDGSDHTIFLSIMSQITQDLLQRWV